MYWRALQELVNGPLNVANSGPLLMAKYNAFTDNGLSVENPTATQRDPSNRGSPRRKAALLRNWPR